jgi:hypothetical protein
MVIPSQFEKTKKALIRQIWLASDSLVAIQSNKCGNARSVARGQG